ncbi:MAG: hypothetical protein Q9206_006835, partial [Seirophora lacunosa]
MAMLGFASCGYGFEVQHFDIDALASNCEVSNRVAKLLGVVKNDVSKEKWAQQPVEDVAGLTET